jgi:hypothetical protein
MSNSYIIRENFFRSGTQVKCIDSNGLQYPYTVGKIYIVEEYGIYGDSPDWNFVKSDYDRGKLIINHRDIKPHFELFSGKVPEETDPAVLAKKLTDAFHAVVRAISNGTQFEHRSNKLGGWNDYVRRVVVAALESRAGTVQSTETTGHDGFLDLENMKKENTMKKLIKKLLGRKSEAKPQELPNEYDYEDSKSIPEKTGKSAKPSKNLLKRLEAFEAQVNAAPSGATVGGGTYIRRNGVRKYVSFKTKDQVLRLLAEAREGKVEILLG